MSNIIRPVRWWDMVSPQGEQEMIPFLRTYMGKGKQFRTPKRIWEDLWRLKRGELNHIMGVRSFDMFGKFKGPKYQRGIICATGAVVQAAAGATSPNLQNITNTTSQTAPTQTRQHYAWDSDGAIRIANDGTTVASITYATLTTQTDDTNDHTGDWWPDQPDVNEGLNWDIQYNTESTGGTLAVAHYLKNAGTNRTTATWYLLDTVSNDHADASVNGSIGLSRTNGSLKSPDTGSATLAVDIDIRATGSGGSVANQVFALTCTGT